MRVLLFACAAIAAIASLVVAATAVDAPISLFSLAPSDIWGPRPTKLSLTGAGFADSSVDVSSFRIMIGETSACSQPVVVSDARLTCTTPLFNVSSTTKLPVVLSYVVTNDTGTESFSIAAPSPISVIVPRIVDVIPSRLPITAGNALIRLVFERIARPPPDSPAAFSVSLSGIEATIVDVAEADTKRYLLLRVGTATEAEAGVPGEIVVSLGGTPLVIAERAFTYTNDPSGHAVAVTDVYPMWMFAVAAPSPSEANDDEGPLLELHGSNLLPHVSAISFSGGLGPCPIVKDKSSAIKLVCRLPLCRVSPPTGDDPSLLPSCVGVLSLTLSSSAGVTLFRTSFTVAPPPALESFTPGLSLPANLAHRLELVETTSYVDALDAGDAAAVFGLDASLPVVFTVNGYVCRHSIAEDGFVSCQLDACAAEKNCEGEGSVALQYPSSLVPAGSKPLEMFTFPNLVFVRTAPTNTTSVFGTAPASVEIGDGGLMRVFGYGLRGDIDTLQSALTAALPAARGSARTGKDTIGHGKAWDWLFDDAFIDSQVAAASIVLISANVTEGTEPVLIPFTPSRAFSNRAAEGHFKPCVDDDIKSEDCPPGNYFVSIRDADGDELASSAPDTITVAHNKALGTQFGLAFSVNTLVKDKAQFLESVRKALIDSTTIEDDRISSFSFANYVATFKIKPLARGHIPSPGQLVEAVRQQLLQPGSSLRQRLPTVLSSQFIGPDPIIRCEDGQYGTSCPAPPPADDNDDDGSGRELGIKKYWYLGVLGLIVIVTAFIVIVVCDMRKRKRTRASMTFVDEEELIS